MGNRTHNFHVAPSSAVINGSNHQQEEERSLKDLERHAQVGDIPCVKVGKLREAHVTTASRRDSLPPD